MADEIHCWCMWSHEQGEKSFQAMYMLMDAYLTAANHQKDLWDTINSSLNILAQQWSER